MESKAGSSDTSISKGESSSDRHPQFSSCLAFSIGQYNIEEYKKLITEWRTTLGTESAVAGIPMVKPNIEHPFFSIELEEEDRSAEIAFKHADLYMIGVKGVKRDWLELRDGDKTEKDINGSKFMNLRRDYGSLEDKAQTKTLVGKDCVELTIRDLSKVSLESLNDANTEANVASRVLTMITLVPEALRFNHVMQYVESRCDTPIQKIPPWIQDLVKNWSRLSTLTRECNGKRGKSKVESLIKYPVEVFDFKRNKVVPIRTVNHLRKAMGMLTYNSSEDKGKSRA